MSDLTTVQSLADEALTSSNAFQDAFAAITVPTGTAEKFAESPRVAASAERAALRLREGTGLLPGEVRGATSALDAQLAVGKWNGTAHALAETIDDAVKKLMFETTRVTTDLDERIDDTQKQLDELTALLASLKTERETFTRQSATAKKLGDDASAFTKSAKEAGLAYGWNLGSVGQDSSSDGAA
ncbi:MAG TPA: hypothetical protein VIP77_09495 [Jiangellaceae bacterium]